MSSKQEELMLKRERLQNELRDVRDGLPYAEGQDYFKETRYAESLAKQICDINKEIKELTQE